MADLNTDVRNAAKTMSKAALSAKIDKAQADCGLLDMQLNIATEAGGDPLDINAMTRALKLACAWASEGPKELARRQRAASSPPAPRRSSSPQPAATEPAPAPAPAETSWGWILGLGAVGVAGLALIVRKIRS